ncbi:SSI family serine proteinase inhibitor [Crossiella sp. SN42]|uniref:SSI family serine proteinase inhibitor n=1 Tax=Crossiella sp. SN42 TaxID=2944808 RepID=UPI00207D402D|nr:SSI family serine proteinase inhibitor [Crossiella sp. SN42]MCO1578234.1 SSI family serine proteinase inhibitor [Crossiella sp. SN42]
MAAFRVPALAFSVLTAVLLVTGPAAADSQDSELTVTFAEGERAAPPSKVADLRCEPTGGTHPHRDAACTELAKVDGRVESMTEESMACTMDYRPVTVTLKGNWQKRPVDFTRTYGNGCALRSQTGPVFDI